MSRALKEPTAVLHFTNDKKGICFHVDLYWKKDTQMRLLALNGQHRAFRHLGRFLNWAAVHGITRIEVETIVLTPDMLTFLKSAPVEEDDTEEGDGEVAGSPS